MAPPSLWTGHQLQTHFSRVANSWSGSGLSCTWIICSRLRRMMSHRDWDALECCWGRGETEMTLQPRPGVRKPHKLKTGHPPLRTEGHTDPGTQMPRERTKAPNTGKAETTERKGNQSRLPGKGDTPHRHHTMHSSYRGEQLGRPLPGEQISNCGLSTN